MSWTTPEQLKQQVQRCWERGEILAACVTGASLFPLRLKLARPTAVDITERFDEVRRWVQRLTEESREREGTGYVIEWRETSHRVHGRNALPEAIIVPSEADALHLIGKTRDAARFAQLATITQAQFPGLREWLARKPLTVLEFAADWARILAVLAHFAAHPRPGCYLRQLDIPDVDTKFIERRRGLLAELLDKVLPDAAIDRASVGARNFARRYGVKSEAPLIRFRALDRALFIGGLSDLSVPPDQFASLRLSVRHVFITENKINGVSFPEVRDGLVIFGLGYGLDRLREVTWLREADVWYWGDIDTHGFAMLDQLRATLPHGRSLLMDRETLMRHRALWGCEASGQRFERAPVRLTPDERALFEDLKHDRLGERVRLEQERIGYQWVRSAVEACVKTAAPPPG